MRVLAIAVLLGLPAAASASVNPSPTTLHLGSLSTGVEVDKNVVFTNGGAAAVTIMSADITVGAGPFAVKNPPTLPLTLQSGATLTVTVSFVAAQTGITNGQLTVTSDDATTPTVQVPLVGGAGDPTITLSTLQVVFSPTPQGSTSAAQVVTISNDCCSDLHLLAPMFETDDASPGDFVLDDSGLGPTFPQVVAFGDSVTFKVAFRPLGVGTFYADVAVAAADSGTPMHVLSLSGEGTAPLPVDMAVPDMSASVGDDLGVGAPADLALHGGPGVPPPPKGGCACQLGAATATAPAPLVPLVLAIFLRARKRRRG